MLESDFEKRSTQLSRQLTPEQLGEIAKHVESSAGNRHLDSDLFRILNASPIEDAAVNVLSLLVLLCRSDRWLRIVEKSLHKKGRCPKLYRKALATLVEQRSEVSIDSIRSLVQVALRKIELLQISSNESETEPRGAAVKVKGFISRKKVATLSFGVEETGIEHWHLCDKLGSERFDEIALDFSSASHIYINVLTALAAFLSSHHIRAELKCTSEVRKYLERIGFAELVSGSRTGIESFSDEHCLTVQPVAAEQTHVIARRLRTILERNIRHIELDYNAVETLFAELIENIERHAGPDATGYVGAQYYAGRSRLGIAIADRGMGLRQSFLDGSNEEAKMNLRKGVSALDLACRPLVTSKPQAGHAGYGLYVASEVVIRNGGTFVLTSDEQTMTRYMHHVRRHSQNRKHRPWKGVWIGIILNVGRPMPIKDVYASLPIPQGYTEEDFL